MACWDLLLPCAGYLVCIWQYFRQTEGFTPIVLAADKILPSLTWRRNALWKSKYCCDKTAIDSRQPIELGSFIRPGTLRIGMQESMCRIHFRQGWFQFTNPYLQKHYSRVLVIGYYTTGGSNAECWLVKSAFQPVSIPQVTTTMTLKCLFTLFHLTAQSTVSSAQPGTL